MPAQCSSAETVENYSVLSEQLWELILAGAIAPISYRVPTAADQAAKRYDPDRG